MEHLNTANELTTDSHPAFRALVLVVTTFITGAMLGLQGVTEWLSQHDVPTWFTHFMQNLSFTVAIIAGIKNIFFENKAK